MKNKSSLGVLATFIMGSIMLSYAYTRVLTMLGYNQTRLLQVSRPDYLDTNFIVNGDFGFKVAFALTDFSDSRHFVDFDDYATIKLYRYGWGTAIAHVEEEYETHPCRPDEIRETPDSNQTWFYPVKNS